MKTADFASPFRVIFAKRRQIILSGDQSELFRDLNGLSAAAGVELGEETAGMGLHRILTHEELFGDLAVAQPRGDESEDFMFARRDPERLELRLIHDERPGVAHNDDFFWARELEP